MKENISLQIQLHLLPHKHNTNKISLLYTKVFSSSSFKVNNVSQNIPTYIELN